MSKLLKILICAASIGISSSSLHAQTDKAQSVRIKAKIEMSGDVMEFSVMSIGHHKMASTMLLTDKKTKLKIILNNGMSHMVTEGETETTAQAMTRETAATTLFELMMSHPHTHFNEDTLDNINSPLLDGYTITVTRERTSNRNKYSGRIQSAALFKLGENGEQEMIRNIKIIEYQDSRQMTFVPLRTEIFDGESTSLAKIEILSYKEGQRIPNFIFEVPTDS